MNSTGSPAIHVPIGSSIFDLEAPRAFDEADIGSPLKKQRASVTGLDDEAMKRRLGLGLSGVTGDILSQIDKPVVQVKEEEERSNDEESKWANLKEDPGYAELTDSKKNMFEDEEL